MKNKTWKNYLGAAALVTVLFAGSVSAYLLIRMKSKYVYCGISND